MPPGRPDDGTRFAQFLIALENQPGGSAGNYAMMKILGWPESEYWRVRNKMLADGRIARGKGKGGSVKLVPHNDEAAPPSAPAGQGVDENRVRRESDLYEICVDVLRSEWAKEQDLHDFHAEITANPGNVETGGVWSRPDISGLSLRVFPNWPSKHYDIWTFEIKPTWAFNPIGIFEASAHARRATHAWALYHVLEEDLQKETLIDRMVEEAHRFGVGLIFFTEPSKFELWDIKVDSVRQTPDPRLLEEFVSIQFSQEARNKLTVWSRA